MMSLDLGERMARAGGMSLSQANGLVAEIGRILQDAVASGEQVRIQDFGVLGTKRVSKRAWDPQRGKRVRRKHQVKVVWRPLGEMTNLKAGKTWRD